jgi:hypothetical protein
MRKIQVRTNADEYEYDESVHSVSWEIFLVGRYHL